MCIPWHSIKYSRYDRAKINLRTPEYVCVCVCVRSIRDAQGYECYHATPYNFNLPSQGSVIKPVCERNGAVAPSDTIGMPLVVS